MYAVNVLCSSLKVAEAVTEMSPEVDTVDGVVTIVGGELNKVNESTLEPALSIMKVETVSVLPKMSVTVALNLQEDPSFKPSFKLGRDPRADLDMLELLIS